MKKEIDKELLTICAEIAEYNRTVEEWKAFESGDMFQSKNYCGGFEAEDEAFWFSYYDEKNENKEYYFKLTLDDVEHVIKGQLRNIELLSTD
jgi:hypothetical protein